MRRRARSRRRLTKAGTFVGTLHYMSPEQLEGREGDPQSDIFAFGAVLYEMLTGRKAFEGTSQASVIAAIMERDVPRLNGTVSVPSAVERIVRKCLEKDPEERWQTAKDLGDELRWVQEAGEGAVGTAASGPRAQDEGAPGVSKRSRRRRFIFRLTIGISVSVVIAAGLLGRRVIAPVDAPATTTADRLPKTSVAPPEPADRVAAGVPPLPQPRSGQAATSSPPLASVNVPPPVPQSRPGTGQSGQASQQSAPVGSALDRSPLGGLAARPSPPAATSDLAPLYQSVVARCRTLLQDRFPFGGGNDLPLTDFGEVFGNGGLFNRFFIEHLAPMGVDTTRRPWAWRRVPPRLMAAQFEQADRIREMFFPAGGRIPELALVMHISSIDASTTRFLVNIDGQTFDATPGVDVRRPWLWPGADRRGGAFAVFEDRVAAPEQVLRFDGPWSLFRFVDAASASVQGGGTSPLVMLRVVTKYHQAQIRLEVSGVNPLAERDWRRFQVRSVIGRAGHSITVRVRDARRGGSHAPCSIRAPAPPVGTA